MDDTQKLKILTKAVIDWSETGENHSGVFAPYSFITLARKYAEPDPKKPDPKALWYDLMCEARDCQRTWGMGFPVISTSLLRKYWQKLAGYLPPEE